MFTPTVASYAGKIETAKEEVRKNPDDADAHYNLGCVYKLLNDKGSVLEQYKILKKLDTEQANKLRGLKFRIEERKN